MQESLVLEFSSVLRNNLNSHEDLVQNMEHQPLLKLRSHGGIRLFLVVIDGIPLTWEKRIKM